MHCSANINGSGDARNGCSRRRKCQQLQKPMRQQAAIPKAVDIQIQPHKKACQSIQAQAAAAVQQCNHQQFKVARMFNEAIVNSEADMITMELTVLGDPYYLADSGSRKLQFACCCQRIHWRWINGLSAQRSRSMMLILERRLITTMTSGGVKFPSTSGTEPVGQFSGLYKVITVQNNFSGGKFTQVLNLLRRTKTRRCNYYWHCQMMLQEKQIC